MWPVARLSDAALVVACSPGTLPDLTTLGWVTHRHLMELGGSTQKAGPDCREGREA